MSVQLAHLHLRAQRGIGDIDAAECDVRLEDGRARAAGDGPHLGAAGVDAVALACRLIAGEFEADELPARMFLAAQDGLAPDELLVPLEGHGEADAGLERID